jgi:monofunctional biosynthetic peptidoglycan transglycosylase
MVIEIENKVQQSFFSHDWEPIENISMNLQKAVIASEDGTFLKHNDFIYYVKAYKSNERGRMDGRLYPNKRPCIFGKAVVI